jgi:hypothetical protein
MLSSELSSSDLSQRVKQFQGNGSIHVTTLLEIAETRPLISQTLGWIAIPIIRLHLGSIVGG